MGNYQSIARFSISILLISLVIFTSIHFANQAYDKQYKKYAEFNESINYRTAVEAERQLECLSKNIYFEAATEPFEGKVAVAQVTLNRVNSGNFPGDVCRVVYQKNIFYDKVICQFSWYCERKSFIAPIHSEHYKESERVARKVLLEGFKLDSVRHAMYYHADYVNPKWKKQQVAKIGHHIFYR